MNENDMRIQITIMAKMIHEFMGITELYRNMCDSSDLKRSRRVLNYMVKIDAKYDIIESLTELLNSMNNFGSTQEGNENG